MNSDYLSLTLFSGIYLIITVCWTLRLLLISIFTIKTQWASLGVHLGWLFREPFVREALRSVILRKARGILKTFDGHY